MGDGALVELRERGRCRQCAAGDPGGDGAPPNRSAPKQSAFAYRIGINLGDVIVEGDDIYGEGVNVAARLAGARTRRRRRGLAHGTRPCGWEGSRARSRNLGEHTVKNIEAPVAGLRRATRPTVTRVSGAHSRERPRRLSHLRSAVANMSGDPEQEYFSDGISGGHHQRTSPKVSALWVAARNTASRSRASMSMCRRSRRQLKVSHVLEGSVRKAGGHRVRITAQLVEMARRGGHVWAERYDQRPQRTFFAAAGRNLAGDRAWR